MAVVSQIALLYVTVLLCMCNSQTLELHTSKVRNKNYENSVSLLYNDAGYVLTFFIHYVRI